jgi:glycosyltransferase involved in cell wall biosynthesis
MIDEEHTGLLCEPGNAADLAEKIRFLLERPALCREWGQNGNSKLRAGFSRKSHYERLLEVYRSVLTVKQ